MDSKYLQDALVKITAQSDIMLALLLVMIAFMMILPLPTVMVDLLIGINLSVSMVLLMLAVYIPTPLSFSAFPAVLLLTTLFRLALSISTTRLILLDADAGKIVETFGEFVVGGNLIVGFVVFLIITIVQFIVITKGSERVAEVSARFSLDSIPGKQMSIDSDMRAGVITLDEARKRRQMQEKESQLYGSMDGAMKFVKGDAIASLVIILVNILGGVSIGMFQNGMAAGEALSLYSILTIGDGLVAQIPALFISITAGIIVTRVTVDDKTNLGQDISRQILAQPNALLVASAVTFIMGLIPGFPTPVFMALSLLFGLLGLLMRRTQHYKFLDKGHTTLIGKKITNKKEKTVLDADIEIVKDNDPVPHVLVELADPVREYVSAAELNNAFAQVRLQFFTNYGVSINAINLRMVDTLGDDGYLIHVQGIPVARGHLRVNKVFARFNDHVDQLPVPYEQGEELIPGQATLWVDKNDLPQLSNAGIETYDAAEVLTEHLKYILVYHGAEFVGIQEVHSLFKALETNGYAELVQEAQRLLSLSKIADVLRRLLSENIPVRNLRQILETLIEFGESEKDTALLTEYVRTGMKRQISYRFTAGNHVLPVYLLDPDTENLIRNSIRQTPTDVFLALDEETSQRFIENIRENEAAARAKDTPARPALLTTLELRRHLKKHLQTSFSDLPILSFQELTPQVRLEPLAAIRL